jgi:hypothetical protein
VLGTLPRGAERRREEESRQIGDQALRALLEARQRMLEDYSSNTGDAELPRSSQADQVIQ